VNDFVFLFLTIVLFLFLKAMLAEMCRIGDGVGHFEAKSQSTRQCWTVVRETSQVNGSTRYSDPCSSKTPGPILTKFVTSDYVMDPNTHAKLGLQGSNGSVPHSGEIYTRSVYFFFLSFCIFYVLAHLHRSHYRSHEHR